MRVIAGIVLGVALHQFFFANCFELDASTRALSGVIVALVAALLAFAVTLGGVYRR